MASQTPARPSGDRRTSAISKRTSILPKPNSLFLDPSVLVAQHASFTGIQPITVGPNTVLHPHSKISSAIAPVVLGEGVIVYERARVGVGIGEADKRASSASASSVRESMRVDGTVLGRHVVIETGAVVEAAEIGEASTIEAGAVLGRGCVVGKFCTVSANCTVPPNVHLPDFTVVYAGSQRRIDKTLQAKPQVQEMKSILHVKQLEIFRKLLSNHIAKWA
ncbi:trimeric LpxA-like protein [Periconia macrospinosa]|uniref:Dynactin subunit 6 n=1 Tax=Periconia macrospinosa TaxID=97972 RepID=A0A2V1DLU4_9PLEO|nr:trimeric LpxA-like protein [Periconia macrospinosa]